MIYRGYEVKPVTTGPDEGQKWEWHDEFGKRHRSNTDEAAMNAIDRHKKEMRTARDQRG